MHSNTNQMRNFILAIIGLLLIVGAFFLGYLIIENKNKKRPVPPKVIKTVFVDTVKNGTVQIVIPANGNLIAKRRVELYAEVQGIFKTGNKRFRPGQNYRNGEALIKIDASEYYASVQAAKSNLYNAVAAIMPDLRLDFSEVFPKWQSYLNNFKMDKTTPKLPEITSEKENYFITGRGIISSYYNVKNLEQRLTKYTIRAPFSGILTEALATEGSLIRNGQKLGEYIDPSAYEMEVALSKTYATFLKVGETVTLNNLNKTQTFTGKVTRVNGNIDATTQTINAYIEVKDKALKEGMYLEANLNAQAETDAVEVNRSLVLDNNQVFVVKDTILDLINVKPVYFSDTKAILKGIPNGTLLLSKPVPGSYAGMAVKIYGTNNKNTDHKNASKTPQL